MFIPLQKADAAQRLVYGRLDETPDRAGDIFDYRTSKPHFERWSEDMRKASEGKSFGNVRAMHGLKAAGKLTAINFDDAARAIELCAQIVDDDEWAKVEAGVYTGFSPGGKYARRWKDGAFTRYTGLPSEISIVDVPANPGATFAMIKAGGGEEAIAFREAGAMAKMEGGGEIRSRADLETAIRDIGDAADKARRKEYIIHCAERHGWTDLLPHEWRESESMEKVGARNAAPDLARIQMIHDHAAALGAACPGELAKGVGLPDIAALAGELAAARDALRKAAGERDDLQKRIAALEAQPRPAGPRLRDPAGAGDPAQETRAARLKEIEAMRDGPEKAAALIRHGFDGR